MRRTALIAAGIALAGCHQTASAPENPLPTIAERAWLMQPLWNDGKSEVSFYEGWIDGNEGRRTFALATQLTKQNFDRVRQTKAESGAPDFKWTLFYEVESGSEQFKHSYVANFAQADLSPMKVSANRFDWCSNQYRELAFLPGLEVHVLARSDDYGNADQVIAYQKLTYPVVAVPLLVRAVDFSALAQVDFSVILMDGTYVDAMVELLGDEKIQTGAGEVVAQKIEVHYAHAIDSTFGPAAEHELYWRAHDDARTLLKLEKVDGGYGFTLIETIRAAYWQENIFDKLARVKVRP